MLLIFGVQYWNFGRKYLMPVKAKTLPAAAGRVSGCLFRGIVSGLRLPWGPLGPPAWPSQNVLGA